jgi:phosphohistidine phosphatase
MGEGKRRTLVLVRHAKSSWDEPTLADHDRPLAPRGQKATRKMAAHLEGVRPRPDLVLCSTARRTQETLAGIRDGLGGRARVELERGIYEADADELLNRLREVDDDVRCAVVIAHNPGLEDLLCWLAAEGEPVPDAFPTGAIAVVSFTGPWGHLGPRSATVEGTWRPRPPRPPEA